MWTTADHISQHILHITAHSAILTSKEWISSSVFTQQHHKQNYRNSCIPFLSVKTRFGGILQDCKGLDKFAIVCGDEWRSMRRKSHLVLAWSCNIKNESECFRNTLTVSQRDIYPVKMSPLSLPSALFAVKICQNMETTWTFVFQLWCRTSEVSL